MNKTAHSQHFEILWHFKIRGGLRFAMISATFSILYKNVAKFEKF